MDNNNNQDVYNEFVEENNYSVYNTVNTTNEMYSESGMITIIKCIIGAVIGVIPAMILWVILGKIGVVAAICGFLMIFCEMYACSFMTKKNGNMNPVIAFVICAVVMLIAVYVCERILWAWELSDVLKEYGLTFSDCFTNFKSLIDGFELNADFTEDLIKSYIFAVIGAVAGASRLFKSK